MNPLLQVKLRMSKEKNNQKPAPRNLKSKEIVTTGQIDELVFNLKSIINYYASTPKIISGILIDVEYNDIVAKSNRIKRVLKEKGKSTNDTIVGARFSDQSDDDKCHIITHYVKKETVHTLIEELGVIKQFLQEQLSGEANSTNFSAADNTIDYTGYKLNKNSIRELIIDCSKIRRFATPNVQGTAKQEQFIITFYNTEVSLHDILSKIGLDARTKRYSYYGDNTISTDNTVYDVLVNTIPYLISMVSSDISTLSLRDVVEKDMEIYDIPDPNNEPIIGVIDTVFDESVYFSKWVEYHEFLDDYEKAAYSSNRNDHGTMVSSIIVDGTRMNPWLEDGCGRFRVRHFGVTNNKISISRLVKKIADIINNNTDIHVWNLCLGTEEEVSNNFISYDGAFLDELQSKKNVIFVISGTNDNNPGKERIRIGSPADSLNSVIVNSVKRDGSPASYSRKGEVLSFFNKPDVSYYGGDYDERIKVYSSSGEQYECGTSFAAPWISRKLCYLIDVIGLPREVAKALIIDSAAGWEYKQTTYKNRDLVGFGIVPIDVNEILSSKNDEIRFTVFGASESYKTVNYSLPVPKDDGQKYPYVARATICYFPECSRTQGVDYTNRELSLKFGRVDTEGKILDINENTQDLPGKYVDERKSRKDFRKWENTKFISTLLKKNRPLKCYEDRYWGISIISKERLTNKTEKPLNYGVVITLKEIAGINRIQDFIKACTFRGWIVTEINVDNRLELYNSNQEDIVFD